MWGGERVAVYVSMVCGEGWDHVHGVKLRVPRAAVAEQRTADALDAGGTCC